MSENSRTLEDKLTFNETSRILYVKFAENCRTLKDKVILKVSQLERIQKLRQEFSM